MVSNLGAGGGIKDTEELRLRVALKFISHPWSLIINPR